MDLRRSLAYLNLGLLGVAVAAEFLIPKYSGFIFYGLLAWMFVSLLIFYGPGSRRGFGGPRPTPVAAGAPPLPGASGPPTRIAFCVYCGTAIGPEAAVCPSCGKPARPI